MRWNRDERGATTIVVAVLLSVLLVSAAFVLDLGQQRVVRRDLQAVADVAALDLSREMRGLPAGDYSVDTFNNRLRQSIVERNNAGLGEKFTATDLRDSCSDLANSQVRRGFCWQFMKWDGTNKKWVPSTSTTDIPQAVEVQVKTLTGFAFGGVTGHREGGSTRKAVAQAYENACFGLGSYAATIKTGDSAAIGLLNGMLESALGVPLVGDNKISIAGYQGLASTQVTLLELLDTGQLGVGTVDEVLDADGVTLGGLSVAALEVLNNRQPPNTAAIQALEIINENLGPIADEPVDIASLINLAQGGGSALDVGLDLFGILTGGIMVANEDNLIALPNLSLPAIPGLTGGVNASLSLIQGPQGACGPVGTSAPTSQVDLDVDANIADVQLKLPLNIPPLLGAEVELNIKTSIDVYLRTVQAIAKLTAIRCTPTQGIDVAVASTLAALGASASVGVTGKVKAGLGLLGLRVADVEINLDIGVNDLSTPPPAIRPNTVEFDVPQPDAYDEPKSTGSDMRLPQLGQVSNSGVTVKATIGQIKLLSGLIDLTWVRGLVTPVLGTVESLVGAALLPALNGIVSGTLNPLLTGLNGVLMGPLADLLGLDVAGADVTFRKPEPTCNDPKLVG